ncbi:DUF6802 family protein [Williamsia sterculiae]|uniref:DUF6802 domain-containing protein n=1 Tax=Williamsia sterculiae TaxID=1344003 RepID=A0A1N7CDR7_9NOCA|nr:DUF6802 family protein [Williamsia sterculiae]SIR61607.1 hypothetical protein SAMN05445060_0054 [Williamsia sterculiae]
MDDHIVEPARWPEPEPWSDGWEGGAGGDSSTDPDPSANLWMVENDRIWDLGPPDLDTDADGMADSITRVGPGRLTVFSDVDRDGEVEEITELRSDGAVEQRRLDPSTGDWVISTAGRVD